MLIVISPHSYAGIKSQRQYEHEPDAGVFDMNSSSDIIQGNTVESNSYIGIELNDVRCIGIYSNKIARYKTWPGIYLQASENISIWRNDVTVFDDAVSGLTADDVVSYEPSVSSVVILDSTKEWDAVKVDSSSCVLEPYRKLYDQTIPIFLDTATAVTAPPPRTCSTRSCLLEDRSSTITRNVKKYEFKRRGVTSSQYSSPSSNQVSSVASAPATPSPAAGRASTASIGSKRSTGTAADKKLINSAQKLADKMVAQAEAMVKKFSPKKKT